ncbi:NAD(P)H-quinone dehydrogenase [Euzebya tangerina]|uniref:NAD(P)H-quinone dehydrogenase n=1 Tax=Euzebya tangerina TaxID=591198 RepID=UPI001F0CCA56|nr:NAD(P)H-quinone dehydrogenase [Euzebya tangerina]
MKPSIVILGGGPGGYEAALVAAEQGADVTVVSAEGLGGNSVLWDCVPSKAMVVSSVAMGSMQKAERLGVHLKGDGSDNVASATEADIGEVMDRVRRLGLSQSADIESNVEAAGARIIRGWGRLAGPDTVEVTAEDGTATAHHGDVVLVATGSTPRILPFFEPDGERVFTSRELFNLTSKPDRLIVVGSGVTGAEYAQAFAKMGVDVHLVSSRDVILPSEDTDAARVLEGEFERWGMTIHRRRRAGDCDVTGEGVRVKIAAPDGTEEEWIEGSHVLFCVGQVPASRGLGLESAGVDIDEHGFVQVDAVSRTNIRTVYAAGDVTGRIMLASVAAMQGRNAMYHALGMAVAPLRWDAVAACVFTSPQVATVGKSGEEIAAEELGADTLRLNFAGNPRAKMEEATVGFVKIHALKGSGTVVGATVVADNASDLITPLSVAVHHRLSVSQVAQAFAIYPSMGGSTAEAARQLMGLQAGASA